MSEYLLPFILLGGWTLFSLYYLRLAYKSPGRANPYILETIPSVFPTIGILCTAAGIAFGLNDFNTNDIQSSLPKLLAGLKSAFNATIFGILGLIIFQKILAYVQNHIDESPNRPRRSSDELAALDAISSRLVHLEQIIGDNLQAINSSQKESSKVYSKHFEDLSQIISSQASEAEKYQEVNVNYSERLLIKMTKSSDLQEAYAEKLTTGIDRVVKTMGDSNKLLSAKFDEFSDLLRKNNTEALVEVMRASTEQFNAQMSELIDRLVKENFKELNTSVLMLNSWQKENKEQVAKLTDQVKIIVEQVNNVTDDLESASNALKVVAESSQQLVDDDSKLLQLITELDKVMISDGKFTEIVDKVEGTIDTLTSTTDAFEETTQKLNVWVRNQMNFSDKAEVLIKQLEDFRNLNGSVWDRYRMEMEKAVKIVAQTSTTLSRDLENINQEFYDRLNDTFQNLDNLIQRFMSGQSINRR